MYTNEQIANLSGKDLVNAYNELADVAQKTHVTRFATRVDGVRRTTNLAEVVRGIAVHGGENIVSVGAEPFSRPIEVRTSPAPAEAAQLLTNPTDALLEEPTNVVQFQAPKKTKKTAVTALRTTAQPKAAKAPRVSVASRCRELFATHTNEEIFAILQAELGLGEDKRWYPAWYRADAKRKGK